MTDEALIEELALVLVNRDQERFDLPRIQTVEDFRFESDAGEYIANARAILPIIQRERIAAGEALKEAAAYRAAATNANCYGNPTDVYETMIDAIRALNVDAIVGGGE